jgi:hypothetical protein
MLMIDNLYSVDIAQVDIAGQVGFASLIALQAGINDLLQINFLGDAVAFKSLSPMGFILQIEDFLELGGRILPDLPAPAQPTKMAADTPEWGLIVPEKEQPFPLGETIIIGRANECDLQLQDGKVSRQHARIEHRADGYWISDLGSGNGVFLNRAGLTEPVRLNLRDEIQIGDTTLKVVANLSAPRQAPTVINRKPPVIRTSEQQPVQSQPAEGNAQPVSYCQRCGNPLSPTGRFCTKCGTPVQP